jgi:hypothetical protein
MAHRYYRLASSVLDVLGLATLAVSLILAVVGSIGGRVFSWLLALSLAMWATRWGMDVAEIIRSWPETPLSHFYLSLPFTSERSRRTQYLISVVMRGVIMLVFVVAGFRVLSPYW